MNVYTIANIYFVYLEFYKLKNLKIKSVSEK